jgi:hypothetical protein
MTATKFIALRNILARSLYFAIIDNAVKYPSLTLAFLQKKKLIDKKQ